MKFCPNCGSPLEEGAVSCPNCGDPLTLQATSAGTPYVDPTDHTAEFDAADISDNKVIAMLPYLLGVVGLIAALLAKGNSPYANFHARQYLKICVCQAIVAICSAVLCWTILVPIAGGICVIILLVVRIICFFQICKGQAKEPAIVCKLGFLK
jgi:uncharacterized membrane protein